MMHKRVRLSNMNTSQRESGWINLVWPQQRKIAEALRKIMGILAQRSLSNLKFEFSIRNIRGEEPVKNIPLSIYAHWFGFLGPWHIFVWIWCLMSYLWFFSDAQKLNLLLATLNNASNNTEMAHGTWRSNHSFMERN